MNNKKLDLLLQRRRRNGRQQNETDQFSKFFDTIVFMEEYYREKFEQETRLISEKEKEAKEKGAKEKVFGKKFTLGQLVFGSWLLSFPMTGFWLWFLWPYLH